MFVHGFDMHRVFIAAPGDLEAERDSVRALIGEVNANDAMPHQILLVAVGLTQDDQISSFRGAVSDNIRQCSYFVQVFEDDWGPKNLFRKALYLAIDCQTDPSLPMQDVLVCLKDAPRETDPEILAFRQELAGLANVKIIRFHSTSRLSEQLRGVCGAWVQSIRRLHLTEGCHSK